TAANWGVNPPNGTVAQQSYVTQLSTPANKYNDHPYWIGVGGGFRPGNWDLSGEFIYLGGKRQFTSITSAGAPQGDSDYQAYSAEAYMRYRIGPGLFFGIEGYYSSGQNADDTTKIKQYQVPNASEGQSNFGNDRTVFMWMNAAQMGYYHERNFSITGFYYGRANLEYSPLAWLRMNLNYLYIGDNNHGTPGTGFSALTRTSGTKTVNVPVGATQAKDMTFVGHEINLITTLRIYQNFDYNIGLAAFLPGDMYGIYTASGNRTVSPETAYAINTKLVYAF
ncbi:MAG TPA: hypothetical protein VLS90_08905, partial [Thermodesulfobacteriota bacterium]|nr:hypothetical protein [Thermodesulfobacteriota bacterium]